MRADGVIGQRIPRVDAVPRVTGRITYGVDLALPGMLVGKILRSPHAHARIVSIDTGRAQRLAGVKAVVTRDDDPGGRYGVRIADRTILAGDKVRFIGESVAAVAAVDEDTAVEALSLIDVVYEPLPAVFDPMDAMAPGAPVLHERMHEYRYTEGWCNPVYGTNVVNALKLRKGDVERGFAEAAVIVENTYTTHAIQHAQMEPQACVVNAEADGRLTVWAATQGPYYLRACLAEALCLPPSRIRVLAAAAGGGFGNKSRTKLEGVAALLSRKARRPVKMIHSRTEEFTATTTRHPSNIRMKTGARRDGTLVACQARVVLDTGAYSETGEIVLWEIMQGAAGPYVVPNIMLDGYCVYTNRIPAGACRGFGSPQKTWASEGQLDHLARELGLDPLEIRLKNAYVDGSISASGEVMKNVAFRECLTRAAEAVGWSTREHRPHRGLGLVGFIKMSMPQTASAAFAKLDEDGRVTVSTSATDVGQGITTAVAQVAADGLGVALDDIQVAAVDTDVSPFDAGAISSRQMVYIGGAVGRAVADVKSQVLEAAATMLEAAVPDLELGGGRVSVRGMPDRSVSLGQIGMATLGRVGHPIIGRGSFFVDDLTVPDAATGQSPRTSPFWMFGAQAVEVEVDPETGVVKVERVVSAHDCGRAINPLSIEGQIDGGVSWGVGWALLEELRFDKGRITNPAFMDYRLPTAMDVPAVQAILVEAADREPKGVAEMSVIGVAAAIRSAIADAVGVTINDLPMTCERVLSAIESEAPKKGSHP